MQDPQKPKAMGPPRLPQIQVPQVGSDSPPALGLIQDQGPPPPAMPPLEIPDAFPADEVIGGSLLKRLEAQIRNEAERRNYELNLDIVRETEQAPARAASLQNRMTLEPETVTDEEIEAEAPFQARSQMEELRGRKRRQTQLKGMRAKFAKELEETLRTKRPGDIAIGPPKEVPPGSTPLDFMHAMAPDIYPKPPPETGPRPKERQPATDLGPGMGEVWRGLTGWITGENTVEDVAHGHMRELIERYVPRETDPGADALAGQLSGFDFSKKPQLPEGVTRDQAKAILTEEGLRVMDRLLGTTGLRDFSTEMVGAASMAIPVAGEIKASAAVAKMVLPRLLKNAPKLLKWAEVVTTYLAGPGVMEGVRAYASPLPETVQSELELIENPKRREATEQAQRMLAATQAAVTSVLYSFSDVLRGIGPLKPKPGFGRQAANTLATGASIPAAIEGVNVLAGEGAEAMREGEGGAADVLADLYTSGGMAGPVSKMFGALGRRDFSFEEGGFFGAAGEYVKQAAPMIAGLGLVHLGTALGAKFERRRDFLRVQREVEKDIDRMVEGGFPESAAEEAARIIRKEAEALAPSHAEDTRAGLQETIHEEIGPERGEAAVLVEDQAQQLLPDVPGESLAQKTAAARKRREDLRAGSYVGKMEELREASRQVRAAELLEGAGRAKTPEEAELLTAMARRALDKGKPLDQHADEQTLETNLRLEADPGARDAALETVADDIAREWRVVGRDEDAGTVTMRDAADDYRKVTIPEAELSRYRVVEDREGPATPHATEVVPWSGGKGLRLTEVVGEDRETPQIVDDLYPDAVHAVQVGMATSARKLADALIAKGYATNKNKAAELLRQMEADGVVVKKGRGYALPEVPVAPPAAAMTMGQAVEADAVKLERELTLDIEKIGRGIATGETTGTVVDQAGKSVKPEANESLDELTDRVARNIVTYGDVVRPDNAEEGSAQILARLLETLPADQRTDALITKLWTKEAIPLVRAMQEQMRPQQPPIDPGRASQVMEGRPELGRDDTAELRTDPVKATEQPVLTAVPEQVRNAHAAALKAGQSEHEAAQTAFEEWRTWHRIFPPEMTHARLVNMAVEKLTKIERSLRQKKSAERRKAAIDEVFDLAYYMRDADEHSAMLSLSPEGRAVLKRLKDLETQAALEHKVTQQRHLDQQGEEGSVQVGLAAGVAGTALLATGNPVLGGAMLLTALDAALLQGRGLRWTKAHVFRLAERGITGPLAVMRLGKNLVGAAAWEFVRSGRSLPSMPARTAAERHAERIRARAETTEPANAGAGDMMGLKDRQSAFGQITAILEEQRAGALSRVAVDMMEMLHRNLLEEGSDLTLTFNRWLELKGTRTPTEAEVVEIAGIESKFKEGHHTLANAVRAMYGDLRTLVAKKLLPTQILRRKSLAILEKLAANHADQSGAIDAQLTAAIHDRLLQAQEAARAGANRKDFPGWVEANKLVDQTRSHRKTYQKKLLEAAERIRHLEQEGHREAARWGVTEEGFAPAVPLRDPSEAKAAAMRKKLDETPDVDFEGLPMPDMNDALAELRDLADSLPQKVRDHVHNPIVRQLTGGHWKSRKGELEQAGNRDPDALRSFFHYVRELYRLTPASQWLEQNMEKIYGTPEIVSPQEMMRGELTQGGREVESIDDRADPGRRSPRKRKLGGAFWELHFSRDGKQRTAYFKTFRERKAAMDVDPRLLIGSDAERKAAKLNQADETPWQPLESQPHQPKILLLESRETDVNPQQTSRTWSVPFAPKVPEVVAEDVAASPQQQDHNHWLLPEGAELRWPSEAQGEYVYRQGGELRRIHDTHGKDAERLFEGYVEDILQTMTGRVVLKTADRWVTHVTSLIRHNVLGMMSPTAAIKEVFETTLGNAWYGGLGLERAIEGSTHAHEFGLRLHNAQEQLKRNPAQWLEEHTMRDVGGGTLSVSAPSIVRGLRTPESKLAKLSPEARKKREMVDDAHVFVYESMLSGHSQMGHLTEGGRTFEYGKPLHLGSPTRENFREWSKQAFSAGVRTADKASWYLRHLAQEHGMQQTLIASYLSQRRAGVGDSEARGTALRFALAQGNIGSRLSQSRFFQTTAGRLFKPLFSWFSQVASHDWRYLVQKGAVKGVSRLASLVAGAYLFEQLGMLGDYDLTRHLGSGLSQVPLLGDMATWGSRKLQYWMHLASDPSDPSEVATRPQWRKDLEQQAREHSPALLREYLILKARTIGSLPEVLILPIWGSSVPLIPNMIGDMWDASEAMFYGDAKGLAQKLERIAFGNSWYAKVYNRLYNTTPDPANPNYRLTRNPATGVTMTRIKEEGTARMLFNALMPTQPIDRTIEVIERTILKPARTAMLVAETKTAADQAQRAIIAGKEYQEEAAATQDPGRRGILERLASESRAEFLAGIKSYAAAHELTYDETKALAKRWRKVAAANLSLTSGERDVVNAYSTDIAFQTMTHLLDDPGEAMNGRRFDIIRGLWYSDRKAFVDALNGVPKATQKGFRDAYKAARTRWTMQEEGR